MGKYNDLDDDDFRNRKYINQHPQFYLKAVYVPERDIYVLRPFIYVNAGERGSPDFVESPVKERHMIQYKTEWQDFLAKTKMPRKEYTREEMMCVSDYRDKYENNVSIVKIPEDNPDYQRIISDFSIKLRPDALFALRRLDGVEEPENIPSSVEKQESQSDDKMDAVLTVLRSLVGQVGNLAERVQTIENKQKEA